MKKNFNIIVLNNSTHKNYSLSINKITLYTLLFSLIVVLSSSIFGLFRFISPHVKQNDYNKMYNYKKETDNLFQLINLDSLITQNKEIKQFLDLIPNNRPVDGIVTKGLNENNDEHNGIDIAAKKNSPVFPAQEGMVIFSNILNNYGNTIIISHPNNYYTVYSHLDKSIVIARDYILTNQVIGYVGQTGNSNGPHLHFEIWKNNHILDPRDFIKEYKLKDVSVEEYK
jgi:murein DD-endopeptidase MepM/ murein hydrolase activator NlpD